MKALHEILKLDYKSYDDYRFTCFFKWCDFYTEYGLPLQSMVNNKALYNWYCQQWFGVVELAFKEDFKDYLSANIQDSNTYLELLASYPEAIEKYYPSVIFNMIKESLKPQKTNENIQQART